MSTCLAALDELGRWEDDLEVEELSSVQSATLIVVIVVHVPTPTPVSPLTTPRV
ncbi:MAG: hypothetical protein ABSH51_20740 [Solirubrobacteraceae bacterium]|jgi:hypothetical protein